ncbi:lipopolysaccharide assembly protein LapA domain-containing protein [Undibacter mobilis]|uniref:LapA family protein n=1 Tax=Undibacter mobilis TaxID=2292256 RepID=A0A371B9C7_9BRAD|nr:LapA family protein [Undibacter mobilis]RDV04142.1 LapA family protein [Undibacter mobilis]
MLRKIVTLIVVVPLAAVIIAFAVANRHAVTVSFDPFSAASPAYAATVPLFVLIFILVILGVVVGGAAAWLRQSQWRRVARRLDGENRRLLHELSVAREQLVTETQRAAAAESAAREVAKGLENRRTEAPALAPPGRA